MKKTPLKQADQTLVQGAYNAAIAGTPTDGQDGMAQGMDKLMVMGPIGPWARWAHGPMRPWAKGPKFLLLINGCFDTHHQRVDHDILKRILHRLINLTLIGCSFLPGEGKRLKVFKT